MVLSNPSRAIGRFVDRVSVCLCVYPHACFFEGMDLTGSAGIRDRGKSHLLLAWGIIARGLVKKRGVVCMYFIHDRLSLLVHEREESHKHSSHDILDTTTRQYKSLDHASPPFKNGNGPQRGNTAIRWEQRP